jgi:hypothetical protein
MNPYMNEEVAWQRLVDLQREVEYSRLIATNGLPRFVNFTRLLAERIWGLGGLAMRRAPRAHRAALKVISSDEEVGSRVA